MLWIDGVKRTFSGLMFEAISSNGERMDAPLSLLGEKLNFGRTITACPIANLSLWKRVDATAVLAKLGIVESRGRQGVFLHENSRASYLIPVSVFLQAITKKIPKAQVHLFSPHGLEMICTPHPERATRIIEAPVPTCKAVMKPYRPRFSDHYSWLHSFPSAYRMWSSVYQAALAGKLDVELPKATAEMVFSYVKIGDGRVRLVTGMRMTCFCALEEPFPFAKGHPLQDAWPLKIRSHDRE